MKVTSPASSGPAGSLFEAQVGAYYLLSMLSGSEPRGLPGTVIDRVEFQRAAEGRPLDDLVVIAHETSGSPAVLEVQVKRSVRFSPRDAVFRDVAGQVAEASHRPDFWSTRHELAVATARTSRRVDGAYQDVLSWARRLETSAVFLDRIARPGSANREMREFVQTFRAFLLEHGLTDDADITWGLLKRFQILLFDFSSVSSESEELAKERAVHCLHADDSHQAENLWTTLTELAQRVAVNGGSLNKDELKQELGRKSFRLSGERRYRTARTALAEASCNALADIGDKVGDVTLTRVDLVGAVHEALDRGRYVEIRGDAGLGKSAVLKHFANQIATQANAVVLRPGRTTPRGWTALRAAIGFDGAAHDLLADLGGDGSGILFIDNLDFFNEEERSTVVDLVRAVSTVPGFAVIATARRSFGTEEPNWLPSEVLERLGRAEPVFVGELSDKEVEELRHASPKLVPLLANAHPARDVARNLFRLARLVRRPSGEPVSCTEAEMAEQWWRTADGNLDADHRDRARLLRALGLEALSNTGPYDVKDHSSRSVDALVRSETLTDLGGDRVLFRHDVFREWAIGNQIHSGGTRIEELPLDSPAPAALARGVEIAARLAIEREADEEHWGRLLAAVSRGDAHGSWRRAALLALVRSEIAREILPRVSTLLTRNRGQLLGELIRTVMAVDVRAWTKSHEAAGIDPSLFPADIYIPSGFSWVRLLGWILTLGNSIPATAIPDIIKMSTAWSLGRLGLDPLTPALQELLLGWLTEIEASRYAASFRDRREPFSGEFQDHQLTSLESDLRTGFLMFCNRTPALAAEYLRSVGRRRYDDPAACSILKFRGSLAQAAPAELAEMTARTLIRTRSSARREHDEGRNGPFTYVDAQFFPASPDQGPFLELLSRAPVHGLSLLRRLVDHAVNYYTKGRDDASSAVTVSFAEGERTFPCKQTYEWSRDRGGNNCVTSGLMALEAWAHRRIDGGKPIEQVLQDVLGSDGSPAAYLLVAVDLLLSHWPKSLEVAIPFIGCPELLCLDRGRYVRDILTFPDVLGIRDLQKEPVGAASVDSLNVRPSRRSWLGNALGELALHESAEPRERVAALLQNAADRLGPPNEGSTLGDPEFMALYALNLLDPGNWHEELVTLQDGSQTTAYRYESPPLEAQHLADLQELARHDGADTTMQAALGLALEDPSRSSAKLAEEAVAWAKSDRAMQQSEDKDTDWMREQAIVTAAMIAMRDGEPELRDMHADWAVGVFSNAFTTKEDPVHRFRYGLRYNPIAIAFVGMAYALKHRFDNRSLRLLLETAASSNPAGAQGFGEARATLESIDERLPRSVLRCAFAACIRPSRDWRLSEEEAAVRFDRHRQRVQTAVNGELAWLAKVRSEPVWPPFPSRVVRRRRGIPIFPDRELEASEPKEDAQREEFVDHQAAALWLQNAYGTGHVPKRPWLRDVVRAYAIWTVAANGSGLESHERIADAPLEWNGAFFNLVANCLPGLAISETEQLTSDLVTSLPDEAFYDVAAPFLRSVDGVYFNDLGLQESIAIGIRSSLGKRLMASSGWHRLVGAEDGSVETHIGPAAAVLFFNDYGFAQAARCYLLPKGIARTQPFLPILRELIEFAPSLFVAMVALNLVEVAPTSFHLPFVVAAAIRWLKQFPNSGNFWIDYGIGRRVCGLVDQICRQEPTMLRSDQPLRLDVNTLLSGLVRLGVPEATHLEDALSGASEDLTCPMS